MTEKFKPSFENYEAEGISPTSYFDAAGLQQDQLHFEQTRQGTDGTLFDFNTAEYGIRRGIIGEAKELLETVCEGDLESAKEELADVFIFASTVANHLGISHDELREIIETKMRANYEKYSSDKFEGRTVREGLIYSRKQWNSK